MFDPPSPPKGSEYQTLGSNGLTGTGEKETKAQFSGSTFRLLASSSGITKWYRMTILASVFHVRGASWLVISLEDQC